MQWENIPLHPREDARGFVINPFEAISAVSGDIQDFHTCSLRSGAVRGNHYHANGEEYILFLGGNYRLATKNMATEKTEEHCFRETTGRLIKISRNVPHAIRNEGEAVLYILCFYVSKDPASIETIRHLIF